MVRFPVGYSPICGLWSRALERRCLGALACILFSIVHLLLELLSLLLVYERKTSQTLFEFKRVEEGPVLIVVERIVDLLIPYHAAIGTLAAIEYRYHTE